MHRARWRSGCTVMGRAYFWTSPIGAPDLNWRLACPASSSKTAAACSSSRNLRPECGLSQTRIRAPKSSQSFQGRDRQFNATHYFPWGAGLSGKVTRSSAPPSGDFVSLTSSESARKRNGPRRPSSIGSAGSVETTVSKPGLPSRTMRTKWSPVHSSRRWTNPGACATVLASNSPMIKSLVCASSVAPQVSNIYASRSRARCAACASLAWNRHRLLGSNGGSRGSGLEGENCNSKRAISSHVGWLIPAYRESQAGVTS